MRKKVKKVIKGLEKASKTHAKQAKVLKSGLKVFKARGGMDASRADFSPPSGTSKGPAGGASAGGNYGGNKNPNQTYGGSGGGGGNRPPSSPPKRKIGGPDTTKDVPYKSNPMVNLVAGAVIPGGGLLGEAAQRKAYKDRQKYARKEGLYREYYIGNQYNPDPSKRTLKPNSPEGKAFIKEAKPMKKPESFEPDGTAVTRCPDGTLPPCKINVPKPSVPMGNQKVQPKMFEFNYNQGGLVRGAGKILKDRNRKVRIF